MIKEVFEKERIIEVASKPKLDIKLFRKKTSAKTPSGYILGLAKKFKKEENIEGAMFCQELYRKIRGIEESWVLKLESWKNKSSFQVIKKPDRFIIITYQKPDQDSSPKEIKREINKNEVNEVLYWISTLDATCEKRAIQTSEIAEKVFKMPWKRVFADRFKHTQLNLILRLLDYYGVTHYRGGNTYYLKKEIKKI